MPMQATTTTPLFAATLRPDNSLRAVGGWLGFALALIVAVPFLVAVPEFLVPGLAGFVITGGGLAALTLRQAQRRKFIQQVTLWPDQLEITYSAPGAARKLWRGAPHTVRLRLVRDDNERATALFVRLGENELELGAFLSTSDRSSFAREFGRSLRMARLSR